MWVTNFQRRPAGNLTAEMNPGSQFGKIFHENKFCASDFQVFPAERQTDIALFMLPSPEPCTEDFGMCVDTAGSRRAQQFQEPATMVIVAMAEDDSVKVADVKIEGGKIGQQGLAAAGIKQPSSGRSLQKAGKTMLAARRDGSANSVFTDDIELQSHHHEQTFKQTSLRV